MMLRSIFSSLAAPHRSHVNKARMQLKLPPLPACPHKTIKKMVGYFARECKTCGAVVEETAIRKASMKMSAARTRAEA